MGLNPDTALVLLSGGQDSTVCLAWALERFAHVETIGFDQLSGVARSSRTGMKRMVNAGPTMRRPPSPPSGIGPCIQQRRMPFFSSMVVMVAVVTRRSVS